MCYKVGFEKKNTMYRRGKTCEQHIKPTIHSNTYENKSRALEQNYHTKNNDTKKRLYKHIMVEAMSNSIEDYLIDSTSHKLKSGASYIDERKNVTFHPS